MPATVAALALSSCAVSGTSGEDSSVGNQASAFSRLPSTAAMRECGPNSSVTVRPGTLTVATDAPAYPPWFLDNDPANGKGFEGAVARAVSERLGYTPEKVRFVTVPFREALIPGAKNFDFNINQFTISDERRGAVDFSSPYYAVAQSVISLANNPAAQANSLAELATFRLGAQQGSTSFGAIVTTLHPAITPTAFDTNDEAKQALVEGKIDALVVDFPTGYQIAGNQIPGSVLVGQFPRPNDVTEFYGLVLAKGSRMTPCVSAAVDSLYADGTLDKLAVQWLSNQTGARVLE